MYRSILVVLDGSELAEEILPYVEALVEKFDSLVTLMQVVSLPTVSEQPPVQFIEIMRKDAYDYLEGVAQRFRDRGFSVECDTPEGAAAQVILRESQERQADLIAMTTHGRTGLSRLFFGNVAEEVLRKSRCPVLLVRVQEGPKHRS